MQMSEDFKKRYTQELCTKELEKEYEVIFRFSEIHPKDLLENSVKKLVLCKEGEMLLEENPYMLNLTNTRYYSLEGYFLDTKSPTEEELIMFELDTGGSRYIYLLLLHIAEKTKESINIVWLRKKD